MIEPTFFNFNIVELGLFFVGAGYVFTFWKKGGNEASSEVIKALKEQHDINSNKISELTHEMGVLTGQLREKDERIKLLEALVQGRNPEQLQYMTEMRKFTEGVAQYMADSTRTMGEISVFMHNLNNPEVAAKVV